MSTLVIESNGTIEGTFVKDGDNGELLGLVKGLSFNVDRLGRLERMELTLDESATAKKKATKAAAKAETDAEPEGEPQTT